MDRLAPILEELFDLRLSVEGSDELDSALPDWDHGHFDAFALEALTLSNAKSEPALVHLDRLVEIADRDPDMIDPAQHGVDSRMPAGPTPSARGFVSRDPLGFGAHANAIMVMGISYTSPLGHAAYVEAVNPNGSFLVSEMNWWGVPGFIY